MMRETMIETTVTLSPASMRVSDMLYCSIPASPFFLEL